MGEKQSPLFFGFDLTSDLMRNNLEFISGKAVKRLVVLQLVTFS